MSILKQILMKFYNSLHAMHSSAHSGPGNSGQNSSGQSATSAELPNKRPRIEMTHQGPSVATPLTIDTREAAKVRITVFLFIRCYK